MLTGSIQLFANCFVFARFALHVRDRGAEIMSLETRDLLKSAGSISSLPTIFIRINDAVNNPRSSLADIGRVISEDPGLTARLLRIVNSAFYSFPSKIDTISRAVT